MSQNLDSVMGDIPNMPLDDLIDTTVAKPTSPDCSFRSPSSQSDSVPLDQIRTLGNNIAPDDFRGSVSKKRKLDSRGQPEFLSSLPARCLTTEFLEQPLSLPLPASLPALPHIHQQASVTSIDLKAPARSQASTGINDDCSSSNEAGKLIQVGNRVGFLINEDNMDILEGISSKVCVGEGESGSQQ